MLSDVHLDLRGASVPSSVFTSRFSFSLPPLRPEQSPERDEDGDLVLVRRKVGRPVVELSIEHHGATELPDVGLQVWRGECLLVDHLLDLAGRGGLGAQRTIIELGAGVGMASAALAGMLRSASRPGGEGSGSARSPGRPAAMHIFCTDHHRPSLDVAARNMRANLSRGTEAQLPPEDGTTALGSCFVVQPGLEIRLRTIDWLDFPSYAGGSGFPSPATAVRGLVSLDSPGSPYQFNEEDVPLLEDLDLIVAVRGTREG